jgi:hypothetical protein
VRVPEQRAGAHQLADERDRVGFAPLDAPGESLRQRARLVVERKLLGCCG